MLWDVFISHATEDKKAVAEPLALALRDAGLSVWYDRFELRIGDRLRVSIDEGLSSSRFGIVVLSLSFFKKRWPQLELDGLAQREQDGQKVILPVWYNVTAEEVRKYSLLLADRVAVNWADGLESAVSDILDVVKIGSIEHFKINEQAVTVTELSIESEIENAEYSESIGDVWKAAQLYEVLTEKLIKQDNQNLAQEMKRRAAKCRSIAASVMRGDF